MPGPTLQSLTYLFFYPTCFPRARSFATSSLRVAARGQATVKLPNLRTPATKSMKVAMREQLRIQGMPNDLGLLEGTFVMPSATKKPSLFGLPKERCHLEWYRLKTRVLDFARVILYKWSFKPRVALKLRNTAPLAQALHMQMYTAFAEGDTETLEKICAEGLLETFRRRIEQRSPKEQLRWTIRRYLSSPRVVSHKAATFPEISESGLRQAVVRIRSRQSLERFSESGDLIPGTDQSQDKKEYLVIQRKRWDGRDEDWIVWGTIGESDWKKAILDT